MVTEPLPDWMQKALLVGTYEDLPILVQVDGLGNLTTGLGAYADRLLYRDSATGSDVDATIETGAVPANSRWVLQNIAAFHDDPTPLVVEAMIKGPTYYYFLFSNRFLLKDEIMERHGVWILKTGDKLAVSFKTLGTDKVAWVNATGYRIDTE